MFKVQIRIYHIWHEIYNFHLFWVIMFVFLIKNKPNNLYTLQISDVTEKALLFD